MGVPLRTCMDSPPAHLWTPHMELPDEGPPTVRDTWSRSESLLPKAPGEGETGETDVRGQQEPQPTLDPGIQRTRLGDRSGLPHAGLRGVRAGRPGAPRRRRLGRLHG